MQYAPPPQLQPCNIWSFFNNFIIAKSIFPQQDHRIPLAFAKPPNEWRQLSRQDWYVFSLVNLSHDCQIMWFYFVWCHVCVRQPKRQILFSFHFSQQHYLVFKEPNCCWQCLRKCLNAVRSFFLLCRF